MEEVRQRARDRDVTHERKKEERGGKNKKRRKYYYFLSSNSQSILKSFSFSFFLRVLRVFAVR
jgi:hypothetical protein